MLHARPFVLEKGNALWNDLQSSGTSLWVFMDFMGPPSDLEKILTRWPWPFGPARTLG